MKDSEINLILIKNYLEFFQKLTAKGRAKLNSMVIESRGFSKDRETEFFSTFGAFQSDIAADEIIKDLRNSRNVNRNLEEI